MPKVAAEWRLMFALHDAHDTVAGISTPTLLICGGRTRKPARRVMEKTPHILLVGEGARWFALQQGFPLETLHTPESLAEWEKTHSQNPRRKGAA